MGAAAGRFASPSRFLPLLLAAGLLGGCATSVPALRSQAEHAFEKGEHRRAVALLEKAVERAPTAWRTRYQLGRVLMARQRYGRAAGAFERAAALYGEGRWRSRIIDKLAKALFEAGREKRLRTVLDREAEPSAGAAPYLRKARYLEKLGDMDKALLAYQKALRFAAPGTVEAHLQAARFFERTGRSERAKELLLEARARAPESDRVERRLEQRGIAPSDSNG